MAALLMAVAAQMDAQEKKEFTLEVYGGEIPDVKPALKRNIFWVAKSPENGIHSYVTILIPMM